MLYSNDLKASETKRCKVTKNKLCHSSFYMYLIWSAAHEGLALDLQIIVAQKHFLLFFFPLEKSHEN